MLSLRPLKDRHPFVHLAQYQVQNRGLSQHLQKEKDPDKAEKKRGSDGPYRPLRTLLPAKMQDP